MVPSHSFQTYTHRNADSITKSNTDDETMITPNDRNIITYVNMLDRSLPKKWQLNQFLTSFVKSNQRKLAYLDCGGGEGIAIETLLSHPIYRDAVEKCHGISLHLFQYTKRILKNNPREVKWYHGNAFDIIKNLPSCSYDLITDIFGAYFYSANRHTLIKEYHRLLKPGGRCYIIFSRVNSKSSVNGNPMKRGSFEKHLSQKWPQSFYNPLKSILVIKKTSRRPPLPRFEVIDYEEKYTHKPRKRTHNQMVKGCAVYPHNIRFVTRPTKKLRPLTYK